MPDALMTGVTAAWGPVEGLDLSLHDERAYNH